MHLADEADEEPSGGHHYRIIDDEKARTMLAKLDQIIEDDLNRYHK